MKFVFLTWKNVQCVDMEKCPFSMTCLTEAALHGFLVPGLINRGSVI